MKKQIKVFSDKLLENPEIAITIIFVVSQFLIGRTKIYIALMAITVIALYRFIPGYKDKTLRLISAVWLAFSIMLFIPRGKSFKFIEIPGEYWLGGKDIILDSAFYFSDILFLFFLYIFISRYSYFREKFYKFRPDGIQALLLLTFMISYLIASNNSDFRSVAVYYMLQLTKGFILFIVTKVVVSGSNKLLHKFFNILISFTTLNSIVLIYNYFLALIHGFKQGYLSLYSFGRFDIETGTIFRGGGWSRDPNVAAFLIALIIPVLLMRIIKNAGKGNNNLKIITVYIFIINIAALIFTATRSAWFAVFITFIYLYKNYPAEIKYFIKKYKLQLSGLTLFISLFYLKNLLVRLVSLASAFNNEGGVNFRLSQITKSLEILNDYPLGIGAGTFAFMDTLKYGGGEVLPGMPHNIFLQIAAESGPLGLVAFVLFLIRTIRLKHYSSNNSHNYEYKFYFLAFLNVLLLLNFHSYFMHPNIFWIFWILLAV